MRKSIFTLCMGVFLIISCTETAVITELEEPTISTRNVNCTLELDDPDIVYDCDVFNSIEYIDSEIHINLNTSLFSDFNECMEAAWVYDPNSPVRTVSKRCGERNGFELYCLDDSNHGIIVEIECPDPGTYDMELCIITECIEFIDLLDDCSNDTGSNQTSGIFCFDLTLVCT